MIRVTMLALAALASVAAVSMASAGTPGGCGDASCGGCKGPGQCVLVPETKAVKKVVYELKCVPYCDHAPPSCLHGRGCTECDLCGKAKDGSGHGLSCGSHCCPQCRAHPKYKKVLVKREVEVGKTCTVKCVPDGVSESKPGCGCKGDAPTKAEVDKGPSAEENNQAPVPRRLPW